MECREAHSLIQDYIENEMTDKKMAEFITHVKNCRFCYEELETFFILYYVRKYLDEDYCVSYHFPNMLKEDMNEKESRIRNNRRAKVIFLICIFGIGIVVLGVVLKVLFPNGLLGPFL